MSPETLLFRGPLVGVVWSCSRSWSWKIPMAPALGPGGGGQNPGRTEEGQARWAAGCSPAPRSQVKKPPPSGPRLFRLKIRSFLRDSSAQDSTIPPNNQFHFV